MTHSPKVELPEMDDVIAGFSSADVYERANAANDAGLFYEQPNKAILIPYLVNALQEPQCGWDCNRVRAFAAQSIGMLEIYDEQALQILISWLTEPGHSGDELIQAVQAIEVFSASAPDATVDLIFILNNTDPNSHHLHAAAMRALSRFGNPLAIPHLLSIVLSSREPDWVRKEASIALARYGQDAACVIPYLIPMLSSPNADLRIDSAVIISQAAKKNFTDGSPQNWNPDSGGAWNFERGSDGEYLIVIDAKNWWRTEGVGMNWGQCSKGVNGKDVLP